MRPFEEEGLEEWEWEKIIVGVGDERHRIEKVDE